MKRRDNVIRNAIPFGDELTYRWIRRCSRIWLRAPRRIAVDLARDVVADGKFGLEMCTNGSTHHGPTVLRDGRTELDFNEPCVQSIAILWYRFGTLVVRDVAQFHFERCATWRLAECKGEALGRVATVQSMDLCDGGVRNIRGLL